MALFKSRQAADVQTVRARLTEAEASIAPLEARLAEVSLAVALSDDYSQAHKIEGHLVAAKAKISILKNALTAAEKAETARLAAARTKEQASRLRAFQQHCGALQRACVDYEVSIAKEEGAWRDIIATAAKARALLPQTGREQFDGLFEKRLSWLCTVERRRVGYRDQQISAEPPLPDTQAGSDWDWYKVPPISQAIKPVIAWCTKQLAAALAVPVPEPRPPNFLTAKAVVSATPGQEPDADQRPILRKTDQVSFYDPADGQLKTRTEVVEYREDTSGEAALHTDEFKAALAEIQSRNSRVPSEPIVDPIVTGAPSEPTPPPDTLVGAFLARIIHQTA